MKFWEKLCFRGRDIDDTLRKMMLELFVQISVGRNSTSFWKLWLGGRGKESRENWMLPVCLESNSQKDKSHFRRGNWKPGDQLVLQRRHSTAQ